MIDRYSRPEMAAIWSEARKLAVWQEIETLALEGWASVGPVPPAAAAEARAASIDPAAWRAREAEIHHDVAAFVDVLSAQMPDQGRWAHFGLTSSDVLDTALAIQLKESGTLLVEGVLALFETVQRRAIEHRDTTMVGRTHGMWAEPTTFGHTLAGFGFQLAEAHHRLRQATAAVSFGKLSGPVGTHSTVPPAVESHVMAALGLSPEPAATQVVGRDRHATFMTTLAVVAGTLERLATEIRHLQRSEVAEVAEPFAEAQKGSSAMPHKHNPILSENVTGLARLIRGWAMTALENVALWHERDISHSSVERIALPDACLALDFALARMNRVMSGMTVDAQRMTANLDASDGTVFSQSVLLALITAGMDRDAAYRVVQEASARAMSTRIHLRQALEQTEGMVTIDLEAVFDPSRLLRHAGDSVDRLAEITPTSLGSRPVV